MRGKFLLIFLILLNLFVIIGFRCVAIEEKSKINHEINFVLNSEFNSLPFMAESFDNNAIIKFNGSISLGIQYNRYQFLISTEDNYISLTNFMIDKNSGINILKAKFIFVLDINKYIWMEAGVGGGWCHESISHNRGVTNTDKPLLSILCNFNSTTFLKYLSFGFLNAVDVIFSDSMASIIFESYLRLNINIYVDFVRFFVDTGVNYHNDYNYEINSVFFAYRAGVLLSLKLPKIIHTYKQQHDQVIAEVESKQESRSTQDSSEVKTSNVKTKDNQDDKLVIDDETTDTVVENAPKQQAKEKEKSLVRDVYQDLYNEYKNKFILTKLGSSVFISGIDFVKNNTALHNDNEVRLKAIVDNLKELNVSFAIGCYADYSGSPDNDIAQAKARALAIKNYFVANGINADKIKIIASAKVYTDDIPVSKREIEIKIIK